MADDNTISIKINVDAETGELKLFADQAKQAMHVVQESAATAKTAWENAFSNLKIRSISEIKADMAALQESFRVISKTGAASWDEISRASQAYQARMAELQRELTGVQGHMTSVARGTNTLREGMRSVSATLDLWQKAWVAWMAVSGMQHQISELTQLIDVYKGLEARLKIVHQDTSEYATAQTQLYDIAMRTRVPLEDTYGLYIKLADSVKALGGNQQAALQLTESISKAIKLSGVSAASAGAALMQLSQAFASGVLRGDEFNSIMEQTPRLAKAIADGMGVPIGSLRALAEQGKLTADVVTQALMRQRGVLESEFKQLPVTVGDAITGIKNQWLQMVGEWDKGSHFSDRIVAALQSIQAHLPQLVSGLHDAAIAAGVLWAAFQTDRATQSIANIISSLRNMDTTMSKLQATAGLVAAAIAGWEIGQMLNQFEVVRQAGVALVAGLEKVAAGFVFLKDAAAAAFTGDTVAAAYDRYQNKLKEIDMIAQQLWQDASDGAHKASVATDAAATSAIKAKDVYSGLADDSKKLHDWWEALEHRHPFDGSIAGVKELAVALSNLSGRDFLAALEEIGTKIEKLSTTELLSFRHAVTNAMDAGVEGSQRLANVLDAITSAAIKRLGIDIHAAATGIRSDFGESIKLLDNLAKASQLTSQEIVAVFAKLKSSTQSIPEIVALGQEMRELGKIGQVSAQEIESAFRSLAKNGVEAFYQQLKAADSVANLSQLKAELSSMYDSGIIGVKQYEESLADLNARQKELSITQGMTRKELEAYNASVKELQDSQTATNQAFDRADTGVQKYQDAVDSAEESNQEFAQTLQDGSNDLRAQQQAAESHAKALEKQAAQLRKSAAAEVERALQARRQAAVLQEQLAIEQAKLDLMRISGSATAAEINQQQALVNRLAAAAQAAKAAAAAQDDVAASAMQAAAAVTQEAQAVGHLADQLADLLNNMSSAKSGHYAFTVSYIDHVAMMGAALADLSDKFNELDKAAAAGNSAIAQLSRASITAYGDSVYGIDALVAKTNQAVLLWQAMTELTQRVAQTNWQSVEAIKQLREEAEVLLKVEEAGNLAYAEKTRQLIAYIDEKQRLLELEQQLAALNDDTKQSWSQIEQALQHVGTALKKQVESWYGWISAAQQAIDEAQYLDQEDLDHLQAGIDDAKDKLRELAQEAMDARDALGAMAQSLQEELMRMRGDEVGLEEIRYNKQLQQIYDLYGKAGELGRKEYEEALQLAEQLHKQKLKQIEERKQRTLQSEKSISEHMASSADKTTSYYAKAQEAARSLHDATLQYIDAEGVRFGYLQKIVDTVKNSASNLTTMVSTTANTAMSIPTLLKNNYDNPKHVKQVELKLHAPSSGLSHVKMDIDETDVDRLIGILTSVGLRTA